MTAPAPSPALIVWCHVDTNFNPSGDSRSWLVGTFGVPFYLFIALMFVALGFARDPKRAVGPYLIGRVKKLYVPFLVWTVVYALLTYAKHRDEPFQFPLHYLWAGSYTHLYFLPLLLTCTVLLSLVVKPLMRHAALRYAVITLLVAGTAAIAWVDMPESFRRIDPERSDLTTLRDFYRAAPAALGALAFALAFGRKGKRLQTVASVSLVGGAVTVICVAAQILGRPMMLARTLSGFGWTLLALGPWRGAWLKPLAWVGRHSFGIYLAHIAFIRAADMGLRMRGVEPTVPVQLFVWAVAFTGAFVLSALLAQSPWTEWIVGYEGEKVRRTMGVAPSAASAA
ncbi:MAG: acyltransferase [Tepidisphaeraceae bacterium]